MKVSKSAPLSVIRQSLGLSGMGFLPHPNSSSSCHYPAGLIRVSRFWVAARRQSSREDGRMPRMPPNGSLELAKSGTERDSFCDKTSLVATWEEDMRQLGFL